jgi:hypothetical protein
MTELLSNSIFLVEKFLRESPLQTIINHARYMETLHPFAKLR